MIAYTNALAFYLINTLFFLYIFVLMLRFLLTLVHANHNNTVSQLVLKLTDPLINPMRHLIPRFRGIDCATLTLLLVLTFLKVCLSSLLLLGAIPNILALLIWALADLFDLTLNIFFYAILIQALLSWFAPGHYHPMLDALYRLTAPVLRPLQRIIPTIAGIDISPLVALIALKLIAMLVVTPLRHVATILT